MADNILVIGDVCIDDYWYGNIDRISPEAPVPVFDYRYSECRDGMALNVANNLKKLGFDVDVMPNNKYGLATKTRLIDIKSKQQMIRIDRSYHDKTSPVVLDVNKDYSNYKAIVLVDYCKGVIVDNTIKSVRLISDRFNLPVFVDSKRKDLLIFDGFWVKINEKEYKESTSIPDDRVIVTLGENGAMWNGGHIKTDSVVAHDVTGAGDTFLAAFVYKILQDMSSKVLLDIKVESAIMFANKAAGITVQRVGTYAPTLYEILYNISKDELGL